jgi:hypothetical protein
METDLDDADAMADQMRVEPGRVLGADQQSLTFHEHYGLTQ